jgi:hypothetical protein
MLDALKPESRSLREEVVRLGESWDRSIRVTWVLLVVSFLSLVVLLARGFGWL